MKVKIGVSLIPLIIANPAYAMIDCGTPIQDIGQSGNEYVTSSLVSRDLNGKWSIIHNLSTGRGLRREMQYSIDISDPLSWSGHLDHNPSIHMVGVTSFKNGQWYYTETLFQRDTIIMHSKASCISDSKYPASATAITRASEQAEPAITPEINSIIAHSSKAPPAIMPQLNPIIASIGTQNSEAAQAHDVEPFETASTQFSVAIIPIGDHGGKAVDVILGADMKLTMVIDTGSDIVAVTDSIAKRLISNNEATEMGKADTTLADGSTRTERMININKLTIGDHHTVYNIPATVGPDASMPLLGIDVLNRFGRFSIDTAHSKLILG